MAWVKNLFHHAKLLLTPHRHMLLKIVPTSGVGLHRKLLTTILNATFLTISNIDTGSLINRFNQDLMLVDLRLPLEFFNTAAELFTCVMQVVLVVVAALYTLIILPIISIVLWIVQHFYLRTSKQLRHLDLESTSNLHTKLSETCTGIVTIRAHAWQSTFRQEFDNSLLRSQEPTYLLYMVQRWLQLVMNLIVAGLSVVVTGAAVGMKDKTNAGAIGVAFLNMTTLGETMTNLITSWTSMETSMGAIARIEAFERDTPTEAKIESPVEVPPEWPAQGNIKIDSLYAKYSTDEFEGTDSSWVLRDIKLEVHGGEKIAICGPSGSGKSTFFLSLLALIEHTSGSITIDGFDISRIDRSILRSKMHVISQDAFLQGDTVRDTLQSAAKGNISEETMMDVLVECSLLDKLKVAGGLEAKMSDVELSVGERQLFALARTILQAGSSPGGIVLLDEATSRYVRNGGKIKWWLFCQLTDIQHRHRHGKEDSAAHFSAIERENNHLNNAPT